ncbi:hypothetical protein WA158_002908 [Blastocystis sp. Blastoise]
MSGLNVTFKCDEKLHQLFINPDVNVYHVKQVLEPLVGILAPEIELYLRGNVLHDEMEFLNCGCTEASTIVVKRTSPVPLEPMDILRSFFLIGELSHADEGNINIMLRQWFESFADLTLTIKNCPLENKPSLTYICLLFPSESTMKAAFEIAPETIFDVPVRKELSKSFNDILVNKTASKILQKTFTASHTIANEIKTTYVVISLIYFLLSYMKKNKYIFIETTLKEGVDDLANSTKQVYKSIDDKIHINQGIETAKQNLSAVDTKYGISEKVGSFFTSAFSLIKSTATTIDSSLQSNANTKDFYNNIKDTVNGFTDGVVETFKDASIQSNSETVKEPASNTESIPESIPESKDINTNLPTDL